MTRIIITGVDSVRGDLVIEVDQVEPEVRLIAEGETIALRGDPARRVARKVLELAEVCAHKGEASPTERLLHDVVRWVLPWLMFTLSVSRSLRIG